MKNFFKQFTRINTSFLIVGILAGLAIFYLLSPKKANLTEAREQIMGPVPEEHARPNMQVYRQNGAYTALAAFPSAKVRGVIYDTSDFKNYFNTTFTEFKNTHSAKKDFHWEIGVYPMVCTKPFEGNLRPRIGMYFIPTMVRDGIKVPDKNDIIDYLVARTTDDSIYYKQTTSRGSKVPIKEKDFIYDEGHLWP
jgi:hypothetical protein